MPADDEIPGIVKAVVVLAVLAGFIWLCTYAMSRQMPRDRHPEPVGYDSRDVDAVGRLLSVASPVVLVGASERPSSR